MMYIHYCRACNRIHMLNGHKQFCPACGGALTELQVSYLDYVSMTAEARNRFLADCQDETRLKHLANTYRMLRYGKQHHRDPSYR